MAAKTGNKELDFLLNEGWVANPKQSPWGEVDFVYEEACGIFTVGTPSHGGIMVEKQRGDLFLSPEAKKVSMSYGSYYCFEEDCNAAVAIREMLDNHIIEPPVNEYFTPGKYEEVINASIHRWNPEYEDARNERLGAALASTPTEKLYKRYTSEFERFKRALLTHPGEYILDNAWKVSAAENVLNYIQDGLLEDETAQELFNDDVSLIQLAERFTEQEDLDVSNRVERAVDSIIYGVRPEKNQEYEEAKTIRALLVKSGQHPQTVNIATDLDSLQKAVGGDIEQFGPFNDNVAIVCNEEGKLLGLPANRMVDIEQVPEEVASWQELRKQFMSYEDQRDKVMREQHQQMPPLTGYVTFTKGSFDKEYSEESRTYVFSSDNKAFQAHSVSSSLLGSCMDGSDPNIRLDEYMQEYHGGEQGWEIEQCLIQKPPVQQELLVGDFLVVGLSEDGEYQSLPDHLYEKYVYKFWETQQFLFKDGSITAVDVDSHTYGLAHYQELHSAEKPNGGPNQERQ